MGRWMRRSWRFFTWLRRSWRTVWCWRGYHWPVATLRLQTRTLWHDCVRLEVCGHCGATHESTVE